MTLLNEYLNCSIFGWSRKCFAQIRVINMRQQLALVGKEFDNVDPQERDWKGVVIALVVIMFICLVIACAVFLFAPMSLTVSDPRTPIKLSNMSRLRSPIYDVRWSGTDSIIYEDITKGVLRFDINTVKTDTLLDTRATVFWQGGHIYYSDSAESVKPVQISEGGPNWEHGIFDWMYEEEIFGRQSKAVWWSLSGDKIVYLSHEKSKEKSITLVSLNHTANFIFSYSRRESYPHTLELPYPKTHEKHLPTYVIKMWDKNLRTLKQMDVQLRDSTAFHYLYGVRWVMLNGKERLVASWANRLQNHVSVTICDYDTAMCSLVFEHKYDADKWAEPSDFSSILGSGDAIYMLLPRAQSDGNSYQQIAKLLIEMENGNDFKWAKLSYLSAGNFDVTKLEAFDRATDTMYFTAAAPSPGNHHLFATKGTSVDNERYMDMCFMPFQKLYISNKSDRRQL
ncbi:unnamed protein product [Angiostrongylus costaricensis]|uniref:DPPIV_N domain-containing protein n=1 Tax=Angiostrongylus costaricensis TaxID=334426 RepID=A0A158PEA0_ANGCS|nr:unnamed protein product [Angiostrongylus costaricensis]